MNKKIFTFLVAVIFLANFVFASFETEKQYNTYPQINVTQKTYRLPDSLSSSIEPLKINDPYASAGQPVIIEFTLTNIGNELGYPYNSIPLSPNSYSLVLMTDNSYDGLILPNGKKIDVWNKMNAWEQFSFATGTSTDAFGDWVGRQLDGRSCGYINIWTKLPKHIQDYITTENDGKKPSGLYTWDCVKIVDEDYWQLKMNNLCGGKITTECIQQANDRTYVGDTAIVILSSDERGKCYRANDRGILESLGATITNRMGIVACGIGKNGLAPAESVTLRFIGLIPRDAPALPPKDFLKEENIKAGYTQSASCASSEYPESCHTIYAGVFPTAKDNLIKILTDSTIGTLITGGKMLFGSLYNLDLEFARDAIFTSTGITNKVVGKPIYEARGIFYIVASALHGEITMVLYLAVLAGFLTTSAVRRRTGA